MGLRAKHVIIVGLLVLAFAAIGFVIGYFVKGSKEDCPSVEYSKPSTQHMKAVDEISAQNIEENLMHYSKLPHYGGSTTNYDLAKKISDTWKKYGFDKVELKKYKILLSYPEEPPVVSITDGSSNPQYTAARMEKILEPSENTSDILPPFIAYSKGGNLQNKKLVYVNYGRAEDFAYLKDQSIDCTGAIAIARYGKIFRGNKVINAHKAGAVGLILYSDPLDYSGGSIDDVDGVENMTFPHTWLLPSTGLQRGTATTVKGDPLTQGLPATEGMYRMKEDDLDFLPKIPAYPMSYKDALEFLKILDGTEAPDDWQGGLKQLGKYNIIMSTQTKRVSMNVKMKLELRDVYNVLATITGSVEPDRLVLVGNHLDGWIFGAADPTSGVASLLEMSRSLKSLLTKGWRPRRSVVLCSWGAEEYGLMGSTEWVEEYANVLNGRAVAYLNVDIAVLGNFTFRGKTSPLLADTIFESAKKVDSGDKKGQSVYDKWIAANPSTVRNKQPKLSSIGSGSDFAPFSHWVGVSCLDVRYMYDTKYWKFGSYPVYHSVHDTFYWMKTFVDPEFLYHQAITRVLLHMTLSIADAAVLPFNVKRYAEDIKRFTDDIKTKLESKLAAHNISTEPLEKAADDFYNTATAFQSTLNSVDKNDKLAVRIVNDQMMQLERTFITPQGLPGRPAIRHVIFAPGKHDSYSSSSFPGIHDSIYEVEEMGVGTWDGVHKQVSIIVNALRQASQLLKSNYL